MYNKFAFSINNLSWNTANDLLIGVLFTTKKTFIVSTSILIIIPLNLKTSARNNIFEQSGSSYIKLKIDYVLNSNHLLM